MLSRLHSTVFVTLVLLIGCTSVSAFAPRSFPKLGAVTKFASGSTIESTFVLKDNKGNNLKVGSIVQVVASGLKAYQVNAKGQGSFVDGKFVQAPQEGIPRGKKNLEIPVGMRGIVTKIYDVEDVAANCPVQVKFEPGKHNELDGFDPPVAFFMHFTESEVETVM
jgi:hypothetical protein